MKGIRIAGSGSFDVDVVGESHYRGAISELARGRELEEGDLVTEAQLCLEDDNPADKNAVAVLIRGRIVGYLDRQTAKLHRRRLKDTGHSGYVVACQATVVGGFDGSELYGVRLDLAEFHNPPKPKRAEAKRAPKAAIAGVREELDHQRAGSPRTDTEHAMTEWEVSGAWKADGEEAVMTVKAPNQRAAEAIAAERGMMVEQAIPRHALAQPITMDYATPRPPPRIQSIEATAKRWKVLQLLGSLGAIAGFFVFILGFAIASQQGTGAVLVLGLLLFFGSLGVYAVGRVAAWWFHG